MDDVVLKLPTGRLIVGDPAELFGDARPLDALLPTGDEFAVHLSTAGLEIDFIVTPAALTWAELPQDVPVRSGFLALLDASALEEFTDLGDEPIDEYELLSERLRAAPGRPLAYQGLVVCPVPTHSTVAAVSLGSDTDGTVCRLVARLR